MGEDLERLTASPATRSGRASTSSFRSTICTDKEIIALVYGATEEEANRRACALANAGNGHEPVKSGDSPEAAYALGYQAGRASALESVRQQIDELDGRRTSLASQTSPSPPKGGSIPPSDSGGAE
jgi:hypothetical protein